MAEENFYELKLECDDFDYVRFTFADICGTARGKILPKKSVEKFLPDKLELYAGTFAYGSNHVVPFEILEKDVGTIGHGNAKLVPIPETFHPIPWSYEKEEGPKVAEVYCEPYWIETNTPQPAPRNLATSMLKKLDDMGLEVLSATEYEFKIYKDSNTANRVPIFPDTEFGSIVRFSLLEDLIFYLDQNMQKVGMNFDNFSCEYSPGQFELVMDPMKGIETADKGFLFKHGVTEMILKKGYGLSFLAKPDNIPGGGNGAHFNFSIWDKKTGKNAFYDADASDNLSSFARHWIAGFIKHAPALTALCSPTINCYRRVHQPWAPNIADWNYDDRMVLLRVKNANEKSTYMENRLPSSIANPYIIMAATIAAGLDGVKHKMSPPPTRDSAAPKLPSSLAEALDILEADTALTEVLGEDFVRYFVGIKREIELKQYGHHDISKFIPEELEAEIKGYEISL